MTAVAALSLAACGGNKDGSADSATTSPASTATFNDADVVFVEGMIPHHQQAVQMAQMALDSKSLAGDKVKSLATRIAAAQQPEIDLMMGWLTAWGKPLDSTMGGMHGTGGMDGMDGMMSAGDMTALGMDHGTDFDKMWLTMMIKHHQGAITASKAVQMNGSNKDVAALAGRIIAAQQAEIDEMTPMIGA